MKKIIDLQNSNEIIFECISGSISYGTWINSDNVDIKGVFVQNTNPTNFLFDNKGEYRYYQLGYFFDLLKTGNWKVIDMLFTPEHFIEKESEQWSLIQSNKRIFFSKELLNGFLELSNFFINSYKKSLTSQEQKKYYRNEMYKKHRTDYDIYNAYHGIRMLDLGICFAENLDVRLKSADLDKQFLIDIKLGNVEIEQILDSIKSKKSILKNLFINKKIPKLPNDDNIKKLELYIRKDF